LTAIFTTVKLEVKISNTAFSGGILLKYFERRRKAKLYRQWVERAGLPPEAIGPEVQKSEDARLPIDNSEAVRPVPDDLPTIHVRDANQVAIHPDVTGDMMAEIDKRQPRSPLLYILLGISIVVLCGSLALLVVQSC